MGRDSMRLSARSLLPAAAIVATLGLFLAMQLRWIRQLSETDLQRRKLDLQQSLGALRNEIDREISGAFGVFQIDPAAPRESWGQLTAESYSLWRSNAKFPRLVRRVLIAEPNILERNDDTLQMSAYDGDSARFIPIDWPAELKELRGQLQPPFAGIRRFGVHTFTGVVLPEAPVLVSPLPAGPIVPGRTASWVIVEIDRQFLLSTMIPQEMRKSVEHGGDFNFQIRRNLPSGAILFQPASGGEFSNADASVSLLEMGPDFFPHGFTGNVPRRQIMFHDNVDMRGMMPERIGDGGVWRLEVQHKAGSLAAAAAKMRRSNLLLGFAMILLVTLDLAALVVLANRAHRLGQAKAEFAAAVSHELRTPLAAICSAADNLAAGVAQDPVKVQQYGAAILKQGNQLAAMVEQILTFASGKISGKPYESEVLDPGEVVNQAIAEVTPSARAAGIEIEQHVASNLPDIMGDAAALRQALVNLLTNAIKYTKDRWVGVRVWNWKPGELAIAVEDRGPGIAPSERKRIFDPFYRGSAAAGANSHGSGLGLTIVDQVARAHAGRVTVEPLGHGSRFTLHLPTI